MTDGESVGAGAGVGEGCGGVGGGRGRGGGHDSFNGYDATGHDRTESGFVMFQNERVRKKEAARKASRAPLCRSNRQQRGCC